MGDVGLMRNSSRPKKKILRALGRGALVAVAAALITRFVLVSLPEVKTSLVELENGAFGLLAGAVAVAVVRMFALSQVYRASLRASGGDLARLSALRISMAAFSMRRIVPGGAAAGSAWAAREFVKAGNPTPRTVVSMLTTWWVSMTSLALLVTGFIAVSVIAGSVPPIYLVGPMTALVGLAVCGVLAARAIGRAGSRSRLVARLGGMAGRLDVSLDDLDTELSRARSGWRASRLAPVFGWAGFGWLCDAAALGMAFAAFGSVLDLGVLMVGFGVANLIGSMPELTPGWLGVMESTLSGVYAIFGVPAATGVVAVLAYRLASYWLAVFAGIVPAMGALRTKGGLRIRDRVKAAIPASLRAR